MSFSFKSKADTGQDIAGHNAVDTNGNPAGGYCYDGYFDVGNGEMPHFMVKWQDGPLDRAAKQKPNGAFVEDLLEVCRIRLEFYQGSKFACEENAEALQHIEGAMAALAKRRERRVEQGKQTPAS